MKANAANAIYVLLNALLRLQMANCGTSTFSAVSFSMPSNAGENATNLPDKDLMLMPGSADYVLRFVLTARNKATSQFLRFLLYTHFFCVTCKKLNNYVTMRYLFVFMIVVLSVPAAYAQDYFTVIKVSGSIIIERTGSSLGTGTSFSQDENLLFKIPDSRAAVYNPQKGRFIITSQNVTEFKSLKSNYFPSAGKISTRALGISSRRDDFKKQFEGDYVILDKAKIIVDSDIFPLSEKKYFYLTYDYNNKIINKKLTFRNDTVFIIKDELLTVDGVVIPDPDFSEMKLVYLEEGEEYGSEIICSFKPVFPGINQLKQEIKVIVEQMEMNSYQDKINEISAFMKEFYGRVDESNLKRWLAESLILKP